MISEILKKLLRNWIDTQHCLLHYLFYYKKPSMITVDYKNYWDDYQSKEKIMKFTGDPSDTPWYFNMLSARYQVAKTLAKIISSDSNGKASEMEVMDVGCGDGAILKYINSETGIKGIGLDISEDAIKYIKEKHGLNGFICDMSSPKAIQERINISDYIIVTEFIEHVPNSEEILLALKNKFSKGLLISIPNTGYYFDRLRLFFGRFPIQWRFHPAEHLRYFTVRDFKWIVSYLGFKVEKIYPYYGIPLLRNLFPNIFSRYALFYLKN